MSEAEHVGAKGSERYERLLTRQSTAIGTVQLQYNFQKNRIEFVPNNIFRVLVNGRAAMVTGKHLKFPSKFFPPASI